MTTDAGQRLARLLGGPALLRLRMRLRGRYQRGLGGGTVTLGKLDEAERIALGGLLGRRTAGGGSLTFDISDIDALLRRAGLAESLRAALEVLDGPIVDVLAARSELQRQWARVHEGTGDARLSALLALPRGQGLLKRLAGGSPERAGKLCEAAARVIGRLPVPPMARSHLAAELLGDAHALDSARPVATLVLAVLRNGRADTLREAGEDESDRALWAEAGVMVNELARPVLFLNLPTEGTPPGTPGEPAYLSLRALLRSPMQWRVAGLIVHVCENPNIVAIAADALGAGSAPLVCTDGMPAAAQRTLLQQLHAAGADLVYHGDFDWAGIGIANVMIGQLRARPWRLAADDYRNACRLTLPGDRQLDDAVVEAQWDTELCSEMRARRTPVDEEAVARLLIEDLRRVAIDDESDARPRIDVEGTCQAPRGLL